MPKKFLGIKTKKGQLSLPHPIYAQELCYMFTTPKTP
jgi:hypothetical protein